MEENGNPGTICNVYHQVYCHASELGTSPTGKQMLAKAKRAKKI
jgi:hypothetical protein